MEQITKQEYRHAKMVVALYEVQNQYPTVSSGDFRDDVNRETQQEYFGKK